MCLRVRVRVRVGVREHKVLLLQQYCYYYKQAYSTPGGMQKALPDVLRLDGVEIMTELLRKRLLEIT